MNHQDYRHPATRKRCKSIRSASKLHQTDRLNRRLRKPRRGHTSHQSSLASPNDPQDMMNTEPLVGVRFFSLRHQALSGLHDCRFEEDDKVEDNEEHNGDIELQLPRAAAKAIQRRPLLEECTICFNAYGKSDNSVWWCDKGCGQGAHQNCFEQWRKQRTQVGQAPSCMYCRTEYAT